MTCRANFVISGGLTTVQETISSFLVDGGVYRVVSNNAVVILAERERTT